MVAIMKREEDKAPFYICGGTIVSASNVVTGKKKGSMISLDCWFYLFKLRIACKVKAVQLQRSLEI